MKTSFGKLVVASWVAVVLASFVVVPLKRSAAAVRWWRRR